MVSIQLYVSSSPTQFFHECSPFPSHFFNRSGHWRNLTVFFQAVLNPASHGCTRAPSWSSLGHFIRMVPFPITVGNEELFVVYFSIPELKKCKVPVSNWYLNHLEGRSHRINSGHYVFFLRFFYHELARIFPSTFKVGSEPKNPGCLDRVGGMRFYLK